MRDMFNDERVLHHYRRRLLEEVTRTPTLVKMVQEHWKKPTRWERFTWRVLHYRNRARDAWLVLIGRKDACDPCEF